MAFMVHCDFGNESQNQHFNSILLIEREGVTQEYSVYSLDIVDNSGRPLKWVGLKLEVC